MNRASILDHERQPLMLCRPARARMLLKQGKAAVFRMRPFTIILKGRAGGGRQPVEPKPAPGAAASGIALAALFKRGRTVIWRANQRRRGAVIRHNLDQRRDRRSHLSIKARGRGSRQRANLDACGCPRGRKQAEAAAGFRTGGLVVARVTGGKKAGRSFGRAAIRAPGCFKLLTGKETVDGIAARFCRKVQTADGYAYG